MACMDHSVTTSNEEERIDGWEKFHSVLDGVFDTAAPARRMPVQALRDGKTYVYFISGTDTPIKIGLSNAPFERLAALQTAHWSKLSIIAKVEGDLEVEKAYHKRFSAHRLNGEWFDRHPDILAEIDRLSAKGIRP